MWGSQIHVSSSEFLNSQYSVVSKSWLPRMQLWFRSFFFGWKMTTKAVTLSVPVHVGWPVTALTRCDDVPVPGLAFTRSGIFHLGLLDPELPCKSPSSLRLPSLRDRRSGGIPSSVQPFIHPAKALGMISPPPHSQVTLLSLECKNHSAEPFPSSWLSKF